MEGRAGTEEIREKQETDRQSQSETPDLDEKSGTEKNAGPEELAAALEAILFAMGDALSVSTLAGALEVSEEEVRKTAEFLSGRLAERGSGLVLNWFEDSLQLSTKPEMSAYLIRVVSEPKKPKLTPTLMETLSIIAFRQPVTRMEVEKIRGVNSDFAISRLVSFDLVQEIGRKEIPGRPLLFGTTQQFLRSFGIRSVDELPRPDELQMEAFREEAEDEVSTSLNV